MNHWNRWNQRPTPGGRTLAVLLSDLCATAPLSSFWPTFYYQRPDRRLETRRILQGIPDFLAHCRVIDYYEVHDHIGLALQAQGRLTEAVAHFDQALLRMPEFAQGHMNRAVAWLQMGDFARGWKEYEWRWRCPEHRMRPAVQPLWDGGPLVGQTILLRAEQGLGDAIQFIRFAPLVKARGGRVVASCSRALTRLLATCDGLDAVVP